MLVRRSECDRYGHKYTNIEGGKYKLCKRCDVLFGPFKTIYRRCYDPETVRIREAKRSDRVKEIKDTLCEKILSLCEADAGSAEQITIKDHLKELCHI